MNLDSSAWHVRWFFFVQDIIGDSSYRHGTNLCHFMRVTMLWGPLVALTVLTFVGLWIAGFIVAPIALFGWGALLLWGGVALLFFVLKWIAGRCADFKRKPGGAIDCVLSNAKAAKSKVCPLISFDKEVVSGV